MAINPDAPIIPPVDVALVPNRETPYNPNDYPVAGTPAQSVDPQVDWQAVDISLLPGVPGQRGPTGPVGPTGVVAAVGPITYDAVHHTVGIDQTGIQISASQVSGIPSLTTFIYTQNSVSSTWTITHNLGFYPNVLTQDSAGTTIEGSVVYTSLNSLTITFSVALTGKAYLS